MGVVHGAFCCLLMLLMSNVFSQQPEFPKIDLQPSGVLQVPLVNLPPSCALCADENDHQALSCLSTKKTKCVCGAVYHKECLAKLFAGMQRHSQQVTYQSLCQCGAVLAPTHVQYEVSRCCTVMAQLQDWCSKHALKLHFLFWMGFIAVLVEFASHVPKFASMGTLGLDLLLVAAACMGFMGKRCGQLSAEEKFNESMNHLMMLIIGGVAAAGTCITIEHWNN
jgi:hypothetical protein